MDTFSYVALAVFAAVLIVVNVVLMPRIRKNMNKTKNNVKNSAAKAAATDTTDDGEYVLETPSLVEDVMTTQEKQAYHYFIDDENSDADKKKGGCLNKSGGKSTITDEEYDQIVTDKLNDFGNKARALNKIGIDETQVNEIEPIRFFGFEKYSRRLNNNFMSKLGEDGRWRSSVCSVTWLFFSDDQILVYTGKFDLLTSSKRETTTEYHYKDITNFYTYVETEQKIELSAKHSGCLKKKLDVDTARKLTDHDTFGLIVPGDEFSCSISGVANAKQIVDGVKQKLREKKVF